MNSNVITLIRDAQEWKAKYSGPHTSFIMKYFDTDTISTHFHRTCDQNMVLREIASANPTCLVQLGA